MNGVMDHPLAREILKNYVDNRPKSADHHAKAGTPTMQVTCPFFSVRLRISPFSSVRYVICDPRLSGRRNPVVNSKE